MQGAKYAGAVLFLHGFEQVRFPDLCTVAACSTQLHNVQHCTTGEHAAAEAICRGWTRCCALPLQFYLELEKCSTGAVLNTNSCHTQSHGMISCLCINPFNPVLQYPPDYQTVLQALTAEGFWVVAPVQPRFVPADPVITYQEQQQPGTSGEVILQVVINPVSGFLQYLEQLQTPDGRRCDRTLLQSARRRRAYIDSCRPCRETRVKAWLA